MWLLPNSLDSYNESHSHSIDLGDLLDLRGVGPDCLSDLIFITYIKEVIFLPVLVISRIARNVTDFHETLWADWREPIEFWSQSA